MSVLSNPIVAGPLSGGVVLAFYALVLWLVRRWSDRRPRIGP